MASFSESHISSDENYTINYKNEYKNDYKNKRNGNNLFLKYIKSAVIAAAATFAVISGGAFAVNAATAVVTGDVVNVRSIPSTDGQVVDKLINGQKVDVISLDGEWAKVSTAGAAGAYVKGEYLTISECDAIVTSESVNVRAGASTDFEVLGQLNTGDDLNITEQVGDFYCFTYDGKTAYIYKSYVLSNFGALLASRPLSTALTKTETPLSKPQIAAAPAQQPTTYSLVTSDNGINLRGAASQDAPILAVLSYNDAADVISLGEEWTEVSYLGLTGFVSNQYTTIEYGIKPDNSIRAQMVNYAKRFIGVKYKWGGTNLNSGVDCSGFVLSIYKAFGISLSRSSYEMVNNGSKVSKSDLLPGDLVFFNTGGSHKISHVGMYIGDSRFIHASSGSAHSVTINSLYDDYYARTYVTACRILN